MFGPQLAAFRYSAKAVAHRTKWGAIGGVLCVIGLVFLSVAAWIYFEEQYGALPTALGAAGIFIVLGFFALLWAKRPPRVVSKEAAAQLQNPMNQPALSAASLVNALIMGIAAGRAVRRKD
ncbi:hypothetical protein PARPLA_00233 [Rhodobacteraceae bacterium THAF1]|uniref:hypothetical protein n=1 Tax=Palleronia sp. THAF1 TaxID=2587842 RepID=UPI000F3DD2F6|nr:hypothetical protein [Palleronia sp. THAF1]QFU10202.1 hypothetical protein FIU81_16095 [Palleronia sp. THAF1]VDC16893.1 hypothetical protein PARPLA_00233 [Rhodobacteraceae bacterium THAF1]